RFYTTLHNNSLELALSSNNKLKGLIKLHKDPLPKFYHSNVTYKITCNDCDAFYVGQTGKRLIIRLKKHRSNINKSSDNLTVVSMNRLLGHNFNWDDTTILDQELSYKNRLVSEMLYICPQKNSLNIRSDTSLLDDSYL
ncbi:hypothetical protein EAG_08369, partial [Camponotus floridanus]